MRALGTSTSTGNLTAPNIYTKTEVDNLLNQKHPLMLTTSNLAIKSFAVDTLNHQPAVIQIMSTQIP